MAAGEVEVSGWHQMSVQRMPSSHSGVHTTDGGMNGGEQLMQDFVQLHLMSILQPFSEHVRELQEQVTRLVTDAAQTKDAVGRHEQSLSDHEQQLAALQQRMSEADDRHEKLKTEVGVVKKERNQLEGNHEMTKASAAKNRDLLQTLQQAFEALQQSCKEQAASVATLQGEATESEKGVMEYLETRLNKQGKLCKELNEKQAEMSTIVQKAKSSCEATSAALKKLSTQVEQLKQDDGAALADLKESATSLDSRVFEAEKERRKQVERLEGLFREIEHMKTWAPNLDGARQRDGRIDELAASVDTQLSRLQGIEAAVEEFKSGYMSEAHNRVTDFNSLESKISSTHQEISRLRDSSKVQADVVHDLSKRTEGIERSFAGVDVRVLAMAEELQSLGLAHGQTRDVLQDHHGAIQQAQTDQEKLSGVAEATSQELQRLCVDLSAEREMAAKLSARLDLCYSYFQGLGKGLQDTHRQVVSGEGGMLPPKLRMNTALPVIPQAPKTPRTPSQARTPSQQAPPRTPTGPRTPRSGQPSPRRSLAA
eukprot:TRINITY_DN121225_c0_g1_i1.p1 TRINITY_DN121225_c0_g1~~TRINITY_DN121225_c0_g1_i1.p1  ORF type:complete len:539 (+),score=154.16 TRINITY_DN121225_c0_g1_i1:89-1705(+)